MQALKKIIMDLLRIQFEDTTKARTIDEEQSNKYVKRGNRRKLKSQIERYNYIKQIESARV